MVRIMRERFMGRLLMVAVGLLLAAPAIAADPVRINGSGSGLQMMKPLLEAYGKSDPEAQFEMDKPLGSSGAIKALLAGAVDIVVTSRGLKAEETKAGAILEKFGVTPLALVAHAGVGQSALTSQELVDIYAGKTQKWPDGKPIRLILRPVEDADSKILRQLSPAMDAAMTRAQGRPGMTIAVTDPEAVEAIAKTPGALGASGLTGVLVEKLPLQVLSLNGVQPSAESLAKDGYPFAKPLDIVTMRTLPEAARKFLAFLYSPAGRKIAEASGVLVTAGERLAW